MSFWVSVFWAGLAAQRDHAKEILAKLDGPLLSALSSHTRVKKFADNMNRSDKLAKSFGAVAVHVDDYSQLAFKIEREPNGNVAVYLSSVRPTPGWVR